MLRRRRGSTRSIQRHLATWHSAPRAALILVVAVPLLRRDRATIGELTVNLAPTRGLESGVAASRVSILIRAVVRWAPIVAFGAMGLAVVAAIELVTLLAGSGRRSMAGLLAHTAMRTKPAIAAAPPAPAPSRRKGEVLTGGNMSGPVIRIGDTVRKTHQPQSDTVQRLVAHAHARGVTWRRSHSGSTTRAGSVAVLSQVTVEPQRPRSGYSDAVITDVASSPSPVHDATVSLPASSRRRVVVARQVPAEVVCHVDFAPYNHVFRDGRFVGAIDFDTCSPGPRLWDLAYTAYHYVPLTPDADGPCNAPTFAARRLPRRVCRRRPGCATPRANCSASSLPRTWRWRIVATSRIRRTGARDGVMYRSHAQWIAAGGLGQADPVAVADLR